jgi:hypothetical protein
MAIKHYADNSGNSDYTTPTFTDLDHLAPTGDALTGGSSMSAGNTVAAPAAAVLDGAPGSEPVNPPPPGAEPDRPGVDVGSQTSYTRNPR